MEINQEYFDGLGEKLLEAMDSNVLREEEWILFWVRVRVRGLLGKYFLLENTYS